MLKMDILKSCVVLGCLIPGVLALEENLTGLIVAGVVAGGLLVVGLISVSVYCFIKSRTFDDDKGSLDITSNNVSPRYHRFPPTMKFRSYAPSSPRSRPPVTFFTVRNDPRTPQQLLPVRGAPYLFEPHGPVMYVDEGPVSNRSSAKERSGSKRHIKTGNGHIGGSVKIREVHSGEEMLNFESSEDENGNKKKTLENRSRSKSRDRKYVKNPDNKTNYRRTVTTERRSRSNSRTRNGSYDRHSVNSNPIMAQPGDIILNPASGFDSQPTPQPHNLSRTVRPDNTFIPVITPSSLRKTTPSSTSAFYLYSGDNPSIETPREDYLTPRSSSEMPSTIPAESSRSDYVTPSADYPRGQEFVYPPRPSANDLLNSPRPPTPEFDADSILYAGRDQLNIRNTSPVRGEVYESTPRAPTPPAPPPPPPAPPIPPVPPRNDYLSAVNRPPTPPPGIIRPVNDDINNVLNQPSSPAKSPNKKSPAMVSSPLHNAVIAEIKNRRQRRPSESGYEVPERLPTSSSGESSPVITDNRRPSAVQFRQSPPDIIPRGLDDDNSPDYPDYEPGSVSAVFDSAMNIGASQSSRSNSVPAAPPPPPPPPPVPALR